MAELEQINKGNVDPKLAELVVTTSIHIGTVTDDNKVLKSDEISTKVYSQYYVSTIANMRSSVAVNPVINLEGHTSENDGGQGTFYWDATSTDDDDGGTIIKVDTIETGRYKRFYTDALEPKWFGAVGDGVADDADALDDLFAAAIGNLTNVNFTRGTYNISKTVTIQGGGSNGILVTGDFTNNNGHKSIIQFTGDPLVYPTMFVTKGSNMSFRNMMFLHNDSGFTTDSYIFNFVRDDSATKQDIDAKFNECYFGDTTTAVRIEGRGMDINNCYFNSIRNGLIIDWPADFVSGGGSDHDKLTTGMRGYRIRNSKMHGSVNGVMFTNLGYNKLNAHGIEISNNFVDTSVRVVLGSLKAATINDNLFTYLGSTVEQFKLDGDTYEDTVIDGNLFSGLVTSELDYPAKQIMISLNGSTIKNVVFSNNTIVNIEREVFVLSNANVETFIIDGNSFRDILRENDDSESNRVFLKALNPSQLTITNNGISEYVRAFNPEYLIDIPTAYIHNVIVEGNSLDSDVIPLIEEIPKDASKYSLVIPSSATSPTSPVLGSIYLNTADGNLYIYDGSVWQVWAKS